MLNKILACGEALATMVFVIYAKCRTTNLKSVLTNILKYRFDTEDDVRRENDGNLFCSSFDSGQNIHTNLSSAVNGVRAIRQK